MKMKRSLLIHGAFLVLISAVMAFITGCDNMKDPYLSVNLLQPGKSCEASQCHPSTELFTYPPTSGHHFDHLIRNYDCDTCHNNYFINPNHMNSILDPAPSVIFSDRNPNGSWNHATQTCSNLTCHVDRVW